MKAAVVLAGCSVRDGAELHEAVITMYAIDKNGGTYRFFAPNMAQHHVINHFAWEEMQESRNVVTESARIARGKSSDPPWLAVFTAGREWRTLKEMIQLFTTFIS